MLLEKKRRSKWKSAFFIGGCCFFEGVFSLGTPSRPSGGRPAAAPEGAQRELRGSSEGAQRELRGSSEGAQRERVAKPSGRARTPRGHRRQQHACDGQQQGDGVRRAEWLVQ